MSKFKYSEKEMLTAFENVLVLAEDQAEQSKIEGLTCADDVISDQSLDIMRDIYNMMKKEFEEEF